MPTALQLAAGHPELMERVRLCRKLLHRRALTAAVAGAVPVPGLDWAVDAALLTKLLPEINLQFGLSADQLARLPPRHRQRVHKSVEAVGSAVIGRVVTRELVVRVAKALGMRLAARQAAKIVPLAGQAVSAALGYAAVRYLGEEHIKDCVRVVLEARVPLPVAPLAALSG